MIMVAFLSAACEFEEAQATLSNTSRCGPCFDKRKPANSVAKLLQRCMSDRMITPSTFLLTAI